MVPTFLRDLPDPLARVVLTALALSLAYLAGLVMRAGGRTRLAALARRSRGEWDDIIVAELSRRVPFWAVLAGAQVSTGFWNMPPQVLAAVQSALVAVAITSLTLAAAAIAGRMLERRDSRAAEGVPLTGLTRLVVRGTIVTVGLLMILNSVGVSITPLLTALGVGGLAVALALQDTLSNLFAGLYVIAAGQLRLGAYVRLETGQEGYVEDIGWRSTTLRMLSNNLVLVPNAKLAGAIIINFDLPASELSVLVDLGVDYGSDLEEVERVTVEVAREVMRTVPGGIPGFEPFIRYHTFGESGIHFSVILRGEAFVSQYLLKHEFIKRVHQRYAKEGITIPFPQRTVTLRREWREKPGGTDLDLEPHRETAGPTVEHCSS